MSNNRHQPVRTRLGAGGRLVLPAAVRLALGVRAGDELLLRPGEGEVRLSTPANGITQAQALVRRHARHSGRLVTTLLAERRREIGHE